MSLSNQYNFSNFQGKYYFDYSIPNWFGIKQKAELCIIPYDIISLCDFIKNNSISKYVVLGNASNVLLKNKIPLLILTTKLNNVVLINTSCIQAGSGVLDKDLSLFYMQNNMSGAEFLYTIPGTIGGNIMSNASCYGNSISDLIISIDYLDDKFQLHTTSNIDFSYRKCSLPCNIIIVSAKFKCSISNRQNIQYKMREYIKQRNSTQPISAKTGGSTFLNTAQQSAWSMIDACGLRGFTIGGAKFSEKNCNFIINYNNASAEDIEQLMQTAETRIMEKFNVQLTREIVII